MSSNPLLYAPLLARLRERGFATTVESQLLIYRLLEVVGPECGPQDLCNILCPVMAKTPEQQDSFRHEFDLYLRLHLLGESTTSDKKLPTATKESEFPAKSARTRRWLFVLGIAVGVALLVWILPHGGTGGLTPVPSTQGPGPTVTEPVGSLDTSLIDKRIAFGLLVMLMLIWYVMVRDDMPLRSLRVEAPPYLWPLTTPESSSIRKDATVEKALRTALSARQDSKREAIDWNATIRATIARWGSPDLRMITLRAPVEYLFLIERRSAEDHLARFYAELLSDVQDTADVRYCYYDGTPNTCYLDDPASQISLESLARRHPNAALVIVGAPSTISDPAAGGIQRWGEILRTWEHRAALLTEYPSEFELRSLTADGLLNVGFGTLEELTRSGRATDLVAIKGTERSSVAANRSLSVSGLKERLGPDVFQWLCACALHYEITWSMTIALSLVPEVMSKEPDEAQMFELFRLPWFRSESMPNAFRSQLLREIPAATAIAARKKIIELLRDSPGPPGSYAEMARSLDLRAHEIGFDSSSKASAGQEFELLVTGSESALDVFIPLKAVQKLGPSSSSVTRNTLVYIAGVVIGSMRFLMRDYGDEDNIFFLVLLGYAVSLLIVFISLLA